MTETEPFDDTSTPVLLCAKTFVWALRRTSCEAEYESNSAKQDGAIRGRKTNPMSPHRGSRGPDKAVGAGSLQEDSQLPNQMFFYLTRQWMNLFGSLSWIKDRLFLFMKMNGS